MSEPLLQVGNLRVSFPSSGGPMTPVRGISFELGRGEIVGLVGESGSGKTLTGRSCLRLVPKPGAMEADRLTFEDIDLLQTSQSTLRHLRGRRMAMIAQDPLTSLHPSLRIGTQIDNALADHGVPRAHRRDRILESLDSVGLPDPDRQAHSYSHQLSGGMRQRAMIALALSNGPSLLIADEPTTALDATVQAQLLGLLVELRNHRQMTVLLITHNLGIIASICDRVLVMRAGEIVESGTTTDVVRDPQHDYTKALLAAVPRLDQPRMLPHTVDGRKGPPTVVEQQTLSVPSTAPTEEDTQRTPVFDLAGVTRHFPLGPLWRREIVHALDDIDLAVYQGESLGIVGESGSGKSTLVRLLALLDQPTRGTIKFQTSELAHLRGADLKRFRSRVQIVFQDPYSSLDPRYTVARSIQEALRAHRVCDPSEERGRIRELLEQVRLSPQFASRYPSELSGGQRQRVCIARALAPRPEVLLADEPVSALDVSVQAQIVELFEVLKREENLTLVMVAHDLALVREMSDRVITLYLGRIAEEAPSKEYADRPLHPYSFALSRATPDPDRIGYLPPILAAGEPPSPVRPPTGCRFHTRCFNAQGRCAAEVPPLYSVNGGAHRFACFYPVTEEQRVELARSGRAAASDMPDHEKTPTGETVDQIREAGTG